MVDRSYASGWMVEGTTALKIVYGMNGRRKHKKQYEGGNGSSFLGWISSSIGSS
jgi:hypothetical protein